ncbi:MAG: ParA family protein [Gammaproteobacteria bacterium]
MKIIAPVNNKGGVGKTKITTILAEYFSTILGKSVLGIDFDPQCNFSQLFLKMDLDPASPQGVMPPIHPEHDPNDTEFDDDGRSSIANIFFGRPFVPYPTRLKNFELAPGHADKLLQAEAVRRADVAEKVHKQLTLLLESPELQEAYDIILIDTAPSKGPLTVSVFKAATHILIPTVMEEQPIQGVYGMMQLWMQEATSRPKSKPLHLLGILPNMFDKQTSLHRNMLESLMESSAISKYIMPTKLGDRIVFAEVDTTSNSSQSIFDLPDSNPAKIEALKFCEYVTNKVFQDE